MVATKTLDEYFAILNSSGDLDWLRVGKTAMDMGHPVVDPPDDPTSLFLGHRPGKIYLGWSTDWDDALASNQLNTYSPGGKSTYSSKLGVRRVYNKNQSVMDYADAQGRVIWLSAKGPDFGAAGGVSGWKNIRDGQNDQGFINYMTSVVNRNKLTVFSFHHEPVGDQTATTDGAVYAAACRRLRNLLDSSFPGHRILFCFNYEENRLRNLKAGNQYVDWSLWIPEDWNDIWDFPSFDFYQYGANASPTNNRAGVEMSHRWWRIDELFAGTFRPTGTSPMPWMNYTPGVDVVFGIGETSARAGAFYNWEKGLSTSAEQSNMTGAKWARDQWNYIFSNINKFWMVSTYNSIGADPTYNDERLVPDDTRQTAHPSLVTQTGDTERTIDVYREKLDTGLTVKLTSGGLPPASVT